MHMIGCVPMNSINKNSIPPAAVITGATGMLGLSLTRLLLEKGVPVLAFVRPHSHRRGRLLSHPLLSVCECPLSEISKFSSDKTSSYGTFYHLAWEGTTGAARNDAKLQEKNIAYTLDAVNLAARLGCSAFIGAGSQAEYGTKTIPLTPDMPVSPETGYGTAKFAAGKLGALLACQYKIKYIWTRILSVYGPYDNENSLIMTVINTLLNGQSPACTAGEQIWDYIYCDDAAAALIAMGEHGKNGAVYTLGSGKPRPLKDYITDIHAAVGINIPVKLGGIPYPQNCVMHLAADINALSRDTGFVPAVSFKEGIKKTVDFCRRNSHENRKHSDPVL